ncbi:Holliday junction branch migration protein RuvA [Paenibacillus doosanensis]|uniref:Holliday junction branch migration complex subunit RuvA n=1 Tax=Paenibacillus konkukensis TaxID=2020716 RepID=A0ABY4RZ35_9BACL|nr:MULTISPECIES: Holliday junction branch migration protein RuvA [Paenibacillus]MCS7458703.1 Holliday junction branch migration protein RuvA [Paenibacillus doosanensis]UQZ86773.1 Holliday junction ATP-dependent DNA helicase RuvA [Paenibacillus konkukensis]
MIDFLRGIIVHRETEYVVVDVRGVGYRVFCPNPYAAQLKEGEETTLFIHYHVREDAHLLFGFISREEQSLFRLLLEVSGIGPKVAIGVLAGGGRPEVIATAIQQENLSFLTKLPGIGRKTAQRMVLDLKDKLGAISADKDPFAAFTAGAGLAAEPQGTGAWSEAKAALIALGYTEAEADRAGQAIKSKLQGGEAVDAVMKLALQALYQQSLK